MRACAQTLTHENYSTTTTAATKTLPAQCTSLFIENMDATDNVLVSFDNGVTFKTIKPTNSLSIDVDFTSARTYKVKSSANTPNAECLYSSES